MTKLSEKKQPAPAKPNAPEAAPKPKPIGSLTDRLITAWASFEHLGWDVVGVFLFTLAAILLLGLTGLTKGTLINSPIEIIKRGFGYGSFLISFFLGGLGFLALRYRHRPAGTPLFRLGRVLLFELWGFLLLGNLAGWGGASLDRAASGLDGGVVGWGLLTLLEKAVPFPWSMVMLALLLFFFTLWAFGIGEFFIKQIEKWLLTPDRPVDLTKEEQSFIQLRRKPF